MVGQTVGKYRVEDRIGRGGMGTVYRAVDETLHREVAIKVLNSELNDPEVAKRFRAEAITVARLSHPGIATIYELFEHDGQWLMVMEFVKGETLERLVERAGPLTAERAAELVMQALGALTHAHSLGVVHRDLKPANLMLTDSGAVKIMDFGIARVSGSEHLTNAGFMMGTPAYMAPEQVLGQEVDARADLYAIGVVLYRVTTGRLPFKGVTPFALAQSQVNDPPTPIRTARQGLPEWLEQVIAVALAKAPGDRFQSAQDFQATLQRCLAGLPMVMPLDASAPTGMLLTPPGLPTGALASRTPMGIRMPTGATATSPPGPTTSGLASAPSGARPVLSEMPTQLNSTAGLAAGSGAQPLPTGVAASTGAQSAARLPAQGPKRSVTTATWVGAAAVVLIGIAAAVVWSRRQVPPPPAPAAGPLTPAAAPATATPADVSPTSPPAPATPPADQPAVAPPDAAASAPPPAKTSTAPASSDAGRTSVIASTTSGRAGPPPATGSAAPGKPDATNTTAPGARGVSAPAATPSRTGGAPATPPAPAPAPAVPPPTDDAFITFKDVKFMAIKGQDSQDQDALMNFGGGQITVVPKDGGTAYASWSYPSITHATFAHTKDPKWDATLPGPPDNLTIHGFMRGARNWLVLQSKTAYVLLRLDDGNWRSVVSAIEGRCGVKVDRLTEGGVPPHP